MYNRCLTCDSFDETKCSQVKECTVSTEEQLQAVNLDKYRKSITQFGNNFFGNWHRVAPGFGCILHSKGQFHPAICERCNAWESELRRCWLTSFHGDWESDVEAEHLNFYSDNPFQNWIEVGPLFGCVLHDKR